MDDSWLFCYSIDTLVEEAKLGRDSYIKITGYSLCQLIGDYCLLCL
jgi:hypothetical protein